jgi:hypothetical protein
MMRFTTQRDEDLLQKLGDFGVLSTAQIQHLFFKNAQKTTLLRRLRRLEALDLIQRIRGLPDGSHGWSLAPTGARSRGLIAIGRRLNRHTLEHDVTIGEVRFALERVGLGAGWMPEHHLRLRAWQSRKPGSSAPENIPDGVFSAEAHGTYLAIAVELELHPKSTERYRKTLRAYRSRQNIAVIWYLVPYESLGRKLDRAWAQETRGYRDKRLRWSLLGEVLKTPESALLHNESGTIALRDLFTLKTPAHGVAHPMSGPNGESPGHSTSQDSPSAADPSRSTIGRGQQRRAR